MNRWEHSKGSPILVHFLQLNSTSEYRRKLLTDFYLNPANKEAAVADLTKVDIFFSSTAITVMSEQALMTEFDLISSVGGSMGLFVGISLLSICEVIQFLMLLCYSIMCKTKSAEQNNVLNGKH